ncbi:MAG: hypothetical protein HY863_04840 [Chloroflexi bacterium]|nr:hypothetical protein [Chloroflexota bacterium]
MRPRIFFLTVGLAAVLLASCAPQATQPPTPLEVVTQETATQPPESVAQPQVTNEAPTVVAVATSRGPSLEATDPATVNLASGQLQLVEFFRFT